MVRVLLMRMLAMLAMLLVLVLLMAMLMLYPSQINSYPCLRLTPLLTWRLSKR